MADSGRYPILFALAVAPVAPLWAMMIVTPRWAWTTRLVNNPWPYTPLCLLYVMVAVPHAPQLVRSIVVAPRLTDVAALLATPWGATLAWIHLVAFDVLVARWIFLDARERGTSRLAVAPTLLLTLLFGPLGYLTYVIVRSVPARSPAG